MISRTTKLSNENWIHAKLRKDCDDLWESRSPGKNFRLVRSNSWSNYGRGSSYLWLRKWNDTYVIGARGGAAPADKYPELAAHASHNGYIHFEDTEKWIDATDPCDWFWSQRPYFIIRPDETLVPASVDITRNNMLWGMGLYRYVMGNNHLISARMLQWYNAAFTGFANYHDDLVMVAGGIVFDDEGAHTYGSTIKDPVVQVYDKGIYNTGRKALARLEQVLEIYIHRHKLFNGGWSWYGWEPEFMWTVIHRHQKEGLEGLAPHWLLDTHMRVNKETIQRQPPWMRGRMESIPELSKSQVTKYWKEEGLKRGFVRLAERGTPLYDEVPLMEPDSTNYDDLIRCPN